MAAVPIGINPCSFHVDKFISGLAVSFLGKLASLSYGINLHFFPCLKGVPEAEDNLCCWTLAARDPSPSVGVVAIMLCAVRRKTAGGNKVLMMIY